MPYSITFNVCIHVEFRVVEIKQNIIEFVTCHYPAKFIVTFLFGKFNAQENSRMTRVCLHIQHNNVRTMFNVRNQIDIFIFPFNFFL